MANYYMDILALDPEVDFTPDRLESSEFKTYYGNREALSNPERSAQEVANKNRFVREGSCRTQNCGSMINSGTYCYNSGGT
jgi:hypothetical protein